MQYGTELPGKYKYVQWTGDESVLPEIASMWGNLLGGQVRAVKQPDGSVHVENDFGSGFHDAAIEPAITNGMYIVQGPYWDTPEEFNGSPAYARVLTPEQFAERVQPDA